MDRYNLYDKALVVLKGFCMGSADIIPGVSGGTMALILGIYVRLVRAIRSFDLEWLRLLSRGRLGEAAARTDLVFLVLIGTGIVTALLVFTRVIPVPYLLRAYPEPVYSLFFGLILASILNLVGHLRDWRPGDVLLLAGGTIIGWLVFTLVPFETPEAAWFLFLAGGLSICAMILPGISGSFILLILNQYATVFGAIGHFRFTVLLPFALGAVTGLLLFSRLLSLLLQRYYRGTMLFIIGLLTASLWVIWPYQERSYTRAGGDDKVVASWPVLPAELDSTLLLSLLLFLSGCLAVTGLHALAARRGGSGP